MGQNPTKCVAIRPAIRHLPCVVKRKTIETDGDERVRLNCHDPSYRGAAAGRSLAICALSSRNGAEGLVYSRIVVPVDLGHIDRLGKALRTAADLAKHYGIPVCCLGVPTETPGPSAHTQAEFATNLEAFGREQAAKHGHSGSTKAYASHDLAIDLDGTLPEAVHATGSDLVVMALHIPDLVDHVWPSNGGKIASHSDASAFVVRCGRQVRTRGKI